MEMEKFIIEGDVDFIKGKDIEIFLKERGRKIDVCDKIKELKDTSKDGRKEENERSDL